MAASDELLADAEGSTASVVLGKNNGVNRAEIRRIGSALPFPSSLVLGVPHRAHVLNTNGRRKPHLLTPRASNNYILSVALAVEVTLSASISTPRLRNPNLPLPSRQANASILPRILADEVMLSEHAGKDARKAVARATTNRTRQEGLSGMCGDAKIGADEVLRQDVEDASERYGCNSCTSPGRDGLGGAVLLPFCIGKGEGLGEGEGGCDSALGGLLGSKVIPADEDPTGGSGSAVDGTGFGEGIFRKTFVKVRQHEYATWIMRTYKSPFSSEVQNVQLVDRDNVEVVRLLESCLRDSKYKNDFNSSPQCKVTGRWLVVDIVEGTVFGDVCKRSK
ncbi:hypothetical protein F5J12DRAFT_930083 [Pisolithus orientalis]|uniref:uncharacterized protein n=1 Tax=Pisolithus orientalis TaxID=936130 RepID=UPI002224E637|nr:uncharacterized protein F5J12DRAFT_930083 [Pisolithus orientalis]KAI5988271.1 hypothetical protein F5J12DRAFT_930083 [Pisolithus orientalis]